MLSQLNLGVKVMLVPRETPCPSCPYRQNCPSGVWDKTEYAKLPDYDKDTSLQPHGVFMCHDAADDKTMCRGWLDTHEKTELLSLRLAAATGQVGIEIFDLPPSGTPVFKSGAEAAVHGMKDFRRPKTAAQRVIDKLSRRRKKDDGGVSD